MVASERDASAVAATGQAREIWELLLELSRTHLRDHLSATISVFDLSPPQAHALQVLEPGRPVPMRDLAVRLRCDASNITGIVDRLEARGLVERRPAPGDRRVKALVVTEQGVALRAQLVERLHRVPAAFAGLSAEEQRGLLDLLRRITVACQEELVAPGQSGS
jgi:MarR family transcriptional regulator, organic hydroperoxide resistance regulator